MKNNYKYKAFISYSHKDKRFTKWLHKKIENYTIPNSLREKYSHLPQNLKRSIFRDEDELSTSSELTNNLTEALENSELLIVVCSINSSKSYWVDKEIRYFKQIHGESSVLAIIKNGEPNDVNNEAFPKSLKYKVDKNGTIRNKSIEPIAADARHYGDKDKAFIKIIAGILKVDFADLWQREKREKKKRQLFVSAIISIFLVLFFYAATQMMGNKVNIELENIKIEIAKIEYTIRHDNISEKKVIQLNEKLNKLEKLKQAKESTQKALGNLKTPLGKKAKEIYKKEGAKAAIEILTSRESLSKKEKLKKELSLEEITLAKLYVETAQFKKAKQSYEDAISLFFDYNNASKYGYFLKEQKFNYKAILHYHKLLKINLLPSQKVETLTRLATLYKKQYKYDKSEIYYNKALQIFQNNLDINNDKNLAKLFGSLGGLYKNKRQYKKAINLYQKAIRIQKKLVKLDKAYYSEKLIVSLSSLATVYRNIHKYKEAEEYYLQAINIYDNNSKTMKFYLSIVMSSLATLYRNEYKYNQSELYYNKALKIQKKLVKYNPKKYNLSFSITLNCIATLYKDKHKYQQSALYYRQALKIQENLVYENPQAYNYSLRRTLDGLVSVYEKINDFQKAEIFYNKALKIIKILAKKNPKIFLEYFQKIQKRIEKLNQRVESKKK